MARRRFFVEEVRNGKAEITGDDAHHLTRVLRVEAGQKYEITDTRRVWLASIEAARKSLVQFSVLEELDPGVELPKIMLYLALIKFDRFEWAIEKATELGVHRIVPFEASRSEHGLLEGARKRVERWRRIAKEASEQSRRLSAPEIAEPVKLAVVTSAAPGIWLDERPGGAPLIQVANAPSALLIGPEGGWSDQEREEIAAAGWKRASLGPMVLRAETAVCAALSVAVQVWMTQR